MLTLLAFEDRPRLVGAGAEATATRANGRAVRIGPADHAEGVPGFLFGHARDLG